MSNSVSQKSVRQLLPPPIDQLWNLKDKASSENITPSRWDEGGGGFVFDRGLEEWWEGGRVLSATDEEGLRQLFVEQMDSMYWWNRGGETYLICESGGILYTLRGNKGVQMAPLDFWSDVNILDKDRIIPSSNTPPTQYIPWGDKLFIIGGGKSLAWSGDSQIRELGWRGPTPQVELLSIQPAFLLGTEDLSRGVGAPSFDANRVIGLGYTSEERVNNYTYWMTWISDTGSESPLSEGAQISWQNEGGASNKRWGVMLKNLPLGPKGCVARCIYRTKNMQTDTSTASASSTPYFVRMIRDNSTTSIIDITQDGGLIREWGGIAESSLVSIPTHLGAQWGGRLWLSDGRRIYWSELSKPEQFSSLSMWDVSQSLGGDVTGLVAYYNNLLIFRESSIDIVRASGTSFSYSNLTTDVGTRALGTIKSVPGMGLLFLAQSGIYSLSGGLDGGSQISLTLISRDLSKEVAQISPPHLARAWAVYSPKEGEYWVHYTRKGETYPTRGIVWHTKGERFSFRSAWDPELSYKWAFTCACVDSSGNIILGTKPKWENNPFSTSPAGVGELVGPHVWASSNYWGWKWTAISPAQGSYSWSRELVDVDSTLWESGWLSPQGEHENVRVISIEVSLLAQGNTLLNLQWAWDWSNVWQDAGSQYMSPPATQKTLGEPPVLGPDDGISKHYFKIGTDTLSNDRIIRVRWDVNTGLCEAMKWRLIGDTPFQFIGYSMTYSTQQIMGLNTKAKF